MTDKTVPIVEEDLDALLLELEAAVGVSSPKPDLTIKAAAPAAPTSEISDDDLSAELAALETAEAPVTSIATTPAAEPVTEAKTEPVAEASVIEAAPAVPARTRRVKAAVVLDTPVAETPVADVPAAEAAPMPTFHADESKAKGVTAFTEEELRGDPVAPRKGGLSFYVDVEDFKRTTSINEANLDNCIMEQSGLRATYGALAANAEAQHARLKARFEVREASLYDKHRKLLAESGEKVTEKAIENAVKLDPDWIKGKNAVIEADTIANINRALVFAIADRRDMLIQIGSDRRQEMGGALRIMEKDNLAARASKAAVQALSAA
jgi:hypothetical protein